MMAMSCRHILADENIILEIARKLGPCTSGGNGVRLRQRPLFTKTYRHDLKGDALSNVIEMLMKRGLPLWTVHQLGYGFLNIYGEELGAIAQIFNTEAGVIEASQWCSEIAGKFELFVSEVVTGKKYVPVLIGTVFEKI